MSSKGFKNLLIIINFITISLLSFKVYFFIYDVGSDLFARWIPQGLVFSYIHFWQFTILFYINIPFGFYFITLFFYLLVSMFLLIRVLNKEKLNLFYLTFSIVLFLAILGSYTTLTGE